MEIHVFFKNVTLFFPIFLINNIKVYYIYIYIWIYILTVWIYFWQWHRGNEAFPKSHLLFRIGLIGQRQNNPSEARREVMKAHLTGSQWILLDLIGSYCNLKILQQNVNHFFSANRISTSESSLILVTRKRWIRLQLSQASLPPASPCRPKLPCRKGGRTRHIRTSTKPHLMTCVPSHMCASARNKYHPTPPQLPSATHPTHCIGTLVLFSCEMHTGRGTAPLINIEKMKECKIMIFAYDMMK